jgi:hypothetical protein
VISSVKIPTISRALGVTFQASYNKKSNESFAAHKVPAKSI